MDRSHLLLTTRHETFSQRGGRPLFKRLFAAVAMLSLLGTTAGAQPLPDDTRGYVGRACGFDMNDNGIIGEPGDDGCTAATVNAGTCDPGDCNVCDGVTTDVDGDGVDEDLIYVDCNSGSDTGNGTPSKPYRTIAKALSMADGPGDGREDIICARATCSAANGSRVSEQDIPVSGVGNKGPTGSWFYTRPRRGPEERDFQYPADPVMIVGWDTDNDGEYPPYDTDQPEPLVFDACSNANCSGGTFTAIGFRTRSDKDYIEFAHFTMKNYGRGTTSSTASISLAGSGTKTGIYIHDIVFDKPNYRVADHSSRAAIYMMMGGNHLSWLAIENIRILDYGAWAARGNANGEYLRFRNIDLFGPKPESGGNSPGWKLWQQKNVEYLNFDYDSDVANIGVSHGGLLGIQLSKSSSNVVFRNNAFRNCTRCILMDYRDCDSGDQTYCPDSGNQTTTNNIVVDRNVFVQNASINGGSSDGFVIVRAIASDGSERGERQRVSDPNCTDPVGFSNLTVKNSVFTRSNGRGNALVFKIGSNCAGAPLGPVTVDNNTFIVDPKFDNPTAIEVGGTTGDPFNYDYRYYAQSYRFRNNVFAGFDGNAAFRLKHQGPDGYYGDTKFPSDFIASSNSYGRAAEFIRDNTNYSSLSAWQSATGYDGGSNVCNASFAADGYRLSSTDTCAKDAGNNAACTTTDIDGKGRARSSGDPCDRGADEQGNASTPTPDPDPDPTTISAPILREAVPVPSR